jgi:hypothetical protein
MEVESNNSLQFSEKEKFSDTDGRGGEWECIVPICRYTYTYVRTMGGWELVNRFLVGIHSYARHKEAHEGSPFPSALFIMFSRSRKA